MNSNDDISSTCENYNATFRDKRLISASRREKLEHNCDSESEIDSENETIDVICENTDQRDIIKPFISLNTQDTVFSFTKSLYANKTVKSKGSESDQIMCVNNVTNSELNDKAKNFLIDSILGNNSSNIQAKAIIDEREESEEAGDEHNGKCIILILARQSISFSRC